MSDPREQLEELLADGTEVEEAIRLTAECNITVEKKEIRRIAKDVKAKFDSFTESGSDVQRRKIAVKLLRLVDRAHALGDAKVELKALEQLVSLEGLELDPSSTQKEKEPSTQSVDDRIEELLKTNPELRAKLHFNA